MTTAVAMVHASGACACKLFTLSLQEHLGFFSLRRQRLSCRLWTAELVLECCVVRGRVLFTAPVATASLALLLLPSLMFPNCLPHSNF
jgi:hypothetical protein